MDHKLKIFQVVLAETVPVEPTGSGPNGFFYYRVCQTTFGYWKVSEPFKEPHLKPDLIFPVQKIRGTSFPWCCANWTQNICTTHNQFASDVGCLPINPSRFRRKRTIFTEILRDHWTRKLGLSKGLIRITSAKEAGRSGPSRSTV